MRSCSLLPEVAKLRQNKGHQVTQGGEGFFPIRLLILLDTA